jgi:hypothetical protein
VIASLAIGGLVLQDSPSRGQDKLLKRVCVTPDLLIVFVAKILSRFSSSLFLFAIICSSRTTLGASRVDTAYCLLPAELSGLNTACLLRAGAVEGRFEGYDSPLGVDSCGGQSVKITLFG